MFGKKMDFEQVTRNCDRTPRGPRPATAGGGADVDYRRLGSPRGWSALLLVGILAHFISGVGCERIAQPKAHAKQDRSTPSRSAAPAEVTAMPPGYVALLRVASADDLLGNWLDLLAETLSAAQLRHIEELCLGPHGNGRQFLSAVQGPLVVAIYDDFTEGEVPRVLIRVQGGTNDALNPWVTWLIGAAAEQSVSFAGTMRQRHLAGTHWTYGEAPGGWLLGNDEPLVKKALEQKGEEPLVAPFDACWDALGHKPVYMACNLKRLRITKVSEWENWVGSATDAVAWGCDMASGKPVEEVFLNKAGSDLGLLEYLGDGVDDRRLKGIAADAQRFLLLSLGPRWGENFEQWGPRTWRDAWSSVFGDARGSGEAAVELLGHQLSFAWAPTTATPSGELFADLDIDDPEQMRGVLKELSERHGFLWRPLPNGNSLLAAQDRIERTWVAGIGESMRVAGSKEALLESYSWNTGHAVASELHSSTASDASALLWVGQGYLEQLEKASASTLSRWLLTSTERTRLTVGNIWKSVQWQPLMQLVGDVTASIRRSPTGHRVVVESRGGIGVTALTLALATWGCETQRENLEKRLTSLCEEIDRAQSVYWSRNQVFAEDLWQLHKSEILLQSQASGVADGFVYRIRSDAKRWLLEVRRDADGAEFQVIPRVGVRKVSAGMRR